ncbi:MAG: hypothetical protein U5K30_05490 [Acidimicrobiales bacterium]|nr:hypothetical protein [Acidimicrobiales bacterium]
MSQRHRSSKQTAPGAGRPAPPKEERKAENRRARHRAHELLAHADEEVGEDLVVPRPHHTRVDVAPEGPDEKVVGQHREYRHWKQKFWKRRKGERARRAALQNQEMPVPEVS